MTAADSKTVPQNAREFLGALFTDPAQVHVCSFGADPGSQDSQWGGHRLGAADTFGSAGSNNFFCIAMLQPGAARTVASVMGHIMVTADDVGTKVDRTELAARMPAPTFAIETSPGNETWGWVFDQPVFPALDPEGEKRVGAVREYMKRARLTDPGTADPVRYIRVPHGKNTKEKYRQADGDFPSVQLTQWNPDYRFAPENLGACLLGAQWDAFLNDPDVQTAIFAANAAGLTEYSADMNDPLVVLAEELGLEPQPGKSAGRIDALCPNHVNHTVRGATGFAFLGEGLMHCHHSGCTHLKSPDFKQMMIDQWSDRARQVRVMRDVFGVNPAAGDDVFLRAETGTGRLAQLEFECVAVGNGQNGAAETIEQLEGQAAEMAGNMRAADRAAEAKRAQALEDLLDRFIYVNDTDEFYDKTKNKRVPFAAFDKHEDVVPLYPYGSATRDKASTRMINAGYKLERVHSYTYAPGKPRFFKDEVETMPGTIQLLDMINGWQDWQGSRVKELPRSWLSLLRYVVQNPAQRKYLIKVLAWAVQNMDKPVPILLVLQGAQGIGKDLLWLPIMELHGKQNCAVVTPDVLNSSYNDYLATRFINLTELDAKGLYGKVKAFIAGSLGRQRVNPKYGKQYSITPCNVVVGTTNDMDALEGIDLDDRRVWFYPSEAELKRTGPATETGTSAWYAQLADKLKDPAEVGRLRWFLESIDLNDFNVAAPPAMTDGKRQMIVASLGVIAGWVHEQVTDGPLCDRNVLAADELLSLAEVRGAAPRGVANGINAKQVGKGLKAAGFLGPVRVMITHGQGQAERRRLWYRVNGPVATGFTGKPAAQDLAARFKQELGQAAQAALDAQMGV